MIIVSGEIVVDADKAEALRAAALEVARETNNEAGCLFYRFYADLETPGRLHVYEEWETAEHLRAHGASAHMATWRARLAELGPRSRDVRKYEATALETP